MESLIKRVTVHITPEYHMALRIKAAKEGHAVSDLVSTAVKQAVLEGAVDLEVIDERSGEPPLGSDAVVNRPRDATGKSRHQPGASYSDLIGPREFDIISIGDKVVRFRDPRTAEEFVVPYIAKEWCHIRYKRERPDSLYY